MIQVWLAGGPATIDMWDLKPDAPEEIRGEFRPIATAAPGVSVCEHLPGLAKVMDRCTLVRSLGHAITAHGPGTTYMATGNPPGPALEYPAAGSLAARLLPPRRGVPPYVTFAALREGVSGTGPGFLGPAFGPFEVEGDPARGTLQAHGVSLPQGFTPRELEARDALRARFDRGLRALDSSEAMAGLDRFHRQAVEILHSDRVRAALDLTREPDALRDDYGRTPLGQGALAARRLIEAGARFVTPGVRRLGHPRRQLPPPSAAASSPRSTRRSRPWSATWKPAGLLDETVVVCAGEFGRTPRVNANAGRDHWARSMAVLLAGGGFPGGAVYGSTDARGTAPVARRLLPRRPGGHDLPAARVSAPATRSRPPAAARSRSSARGRSSPWRDDPRLFTRALHQWAPVFNRLETHRGTRRWEFSACVPRSGGLLRAREPSSDVPPSIMLIDI